MYFTTKFVEGYFVRPNKNQSVISRTYTHLSHLCYFYILYYTSFTFYGLCHKCPRKKYGNMICDVGLTRILKWVLKCPSKLCHLQNSIYLHTGDILKHMVKKNCLIWQWTGIHDYINYFSTFYIMIYAIISLYQAFGRNVISRTPT